MVLADPTLVLNRNWIPVDITTVMNALCKIYDGSARAMNPDDYSLHDFDSWGELRAVEGKKFVRTARLEIPAPEVIVLSHFTRVPARHVAFSRANLFRRDLYTCQYCGKKPGTTELTIDHVIPRARGGTSTWTNCVVACIHCNSRKADHSLAEAGLTLRRTPEKPQWSPKLTFARIQMKSSWEKFISDAYWNVELKE